MRRTAICLALALVALAGTTVPAGAAGAAASPLRAYGGGGVSFRYPKTWHVAPKAWHWGGPALQLVTYLSTQTMHDPCVRSGASATCAPPLDVLAPRGAVLVTWTRGIPSAMPRATGARVKLGGRPARLSLLRPGACRYLAADETVTATISLPSQTLVMQACLRGPGTTANVLRVRAMLATLKLR
jgi:hypothetical protein